MNLPDFHQKPHFLRATFHINTPMFIAGANPQEPELTPTGFKGVMRFWWRALNWSRIRINSETKEQALKELHQQEAELFGLASGDNKGGQGICLVDALSLSTSRTWQVRADNGIKYLMGQGLKNRTAFADQQQFSVTLTVNQKAYIEKIKDVLILIGLVGGFGSRSRHGFGSVTLTDLTIENIQGDQDSLTINQNAQKSLNSLLTKYQCLENKQLPPFTAFYSSTIIRFGILHDNALNIMNQFGETQNTYFRTGNNNKKIPVPQRQGFGLPRKGVSTSLSRRSSMVMQHIHKQGNQYQLIHCFFDCEFEPNKPLKDSELTTIKNFMTTVGGQIL